MKDLVQDMVQKDPAKRPDIHECVRRLGDIRKNLSNYKLRSRAGSAKDAAVANVYLGLAHSFRRIRLGRYSAIPGR